MKLMTLFYSLPLSNFQKGTTLLELMTVVGIVSIISALALTSLGTIIANNRRDNTLHELKTTLNYARIYAIKSNRYVTLCPYNGFKCASHWDGDIAVFIDKSNIGDIDNEDTLLRVLEGHNDGRLSYQRHSLTFQPDGMVYVLGSGSFKYCHEQEEIQDKRITVSQIGRTRLRDYNKC
ncbi:hypothetical protein CWC05_07190 [Pseudoalteromonas ruthenica]|uniref:Type II secretion system protein H n=2 Tax=Pseudoalteromonas ruthenica TaxID=151081 RepID=A0A5S3Z5V8_9GAMM|nr:hypothetical protein CWC24_01700 [Pseudoalteromonas ruthenica]TMO50148.1 hypothetical protein CWC23_13190 [Pseudoalteromonas ruthenica]TMP87634.1 hypothetical protein CWC05_07190 [Pseudoalteromonas ruthenica]